MRGAFLFAFLFLVLLGSEAALPRSLRTVRERIEVLRKLRTETVDREVDLAPASFLESRSSLRSRQLDVTDRDGDGHVDGEEEEPAFAPAPPPDGIEYMSMPEYMVVDYNAPPPFPAEYMKELMAESNEYAAQVEETELESGPTTASEPTEAEKELAEHPTPEYEEEVKRKALEQQQADPQLKALYAENIKELEEEVRNLEMGNGGVAETPAAELSPEIAAAVEEAEAEAEGDAEPNSVPAPTSVDSRPPSKEELIAQLRREIEAQEKDPMYASQVDAAKQQLEELEYGSGVQDGNALAESIVQEEAERNPQLMKELEKAEAAAAESSASGSGPAGDDDAGDKPSREEEVAAASDNLAELSKLESELQAATDARDVRALEGLQERISEVEAALGDHSEEVMEEARKEHGLEVMAHEGEQQKEEEEERRDDAQQALEQAKREEEEESARRQAELDRKAKEAEEEARKAMETAVPPPEPEPEEEEEEGKDADGSGDQEDFEKDVDSLVRSKLASNEQPERIRSLLTHMLSYIDDEERAARAASDKHSAGLKEELAALEAAKEKLAREIEQTAALEDKARDAIERIQQQIDSISHAPSEGRFMSLPGRVSRGQGQAQQSLSPSSSSSSSTGGYSAARLRAAHAEGMAVLAAVRATARTPHHNVRFAASALAAQRGTPSDSEDRREALEALSKAIKQLQDAVEGFQAAVNEPASSSSPSSASQREEELEYQAEAEAEAVDEVLSSAGEAGLSLSDDRLRALEAERDLKRKELTALRAARKALEQRRDAVVTQAAALEKLEASLEDNLNEQAAQWRKEREAIERIIKQHLD